MVPMREAVNPPSLGPPSGPFSRVVRTGDLVFLSGAVGYDYPGHVVDKGDPEAQAYQALLNLQTALEAVGGTVDDIAKLTVFLTDIRDRPAVAAARIRFFKPPYPADTLVEVSHLVDPDLRVEIDAIAVLGQTPSRKMNDEPPPVNGGDG
jgi:enamine deaminase RidA (YjgF/YER057c/UK114 family)